MNGSHIIKSLNLTEGDVLTLKKTADRMEFETLPIIAETTCWGVCECDGTDSICTLCNAYK